MFKSLDGTMMAKVFMIRFVDDTSGSINNLLLPEPQPLQCYITQATQETQHLTEICPIHDNE